MAALSCHMHAVLHTHRYILYPKEHSARWPAFKRGLGRSPKRGSCHRRGRCSSASSCKSSSWLHVLITRIIGRAGASIRASGISDSSMLAPEMRTPSHTGQHQARFLTSIPTFCRYQRHKHLMRMRCQPEDAEIQSYRYFPTWIYPNLQAGVHSQASIITTLLACRKTAEIAVDIFLKDKVVVGLGNGPFAAQVIECIAEKRKLQPAQSFKFVPATDTAAAEAAMQGLPVAELAPDSQVNHPDLLSLSRVSRGGFSAARPIR